MATSFIIGVDIGTSGTKAIAFTAEGSVTASAYRSYQPIMTEPGMHELEPATLIEAACACIKEIARQTSTQPIGISFSSAMHSLVAVDANGKPLTRLITWADSRAADYAAKLKNTPHGKAIYQHSGTPIHPMSPLCKIMWLREEKPELFAATHKFIGIKELLFHYFFGEYLIDHSIASCTGLFDNYAREWYAPSLKVAGITADKLSTPVSTTHIIKGLKVDVGIDSNTPFIIGASDGVLANLGSNATQPGDAAITIGTSGAVRMIIKQPKHDAQERIFNYILTDELYVSGGPINNGIAIVKWYAQQFLQRSMTSAEDIRWFVEAAAKAPAGADGLLFLPYLLGERAPIWDANARGVFLGITAQHTQAHFMRAVIEGINYAMAHVAQSVQDTVGEMQRIYASGGFINSSLWLQWLTDLLGKEIIIINKEDASSIGAAILGMQALGNLSEQLYLSFFPVQERYTPNVETHNLYRRYFSVYITVYERLKPSFEALQGL